MDAESLFSLEVIVNFVKLNHNRPLADPADPKSRLRAQCLFPTIAFRLLDYPTIAINLLDEVDTNELKRRLNIQSSFESIDKLPCFRDLLDKDDRYMFNKGKSCLFRCDLESLKVHLNHAPMYLMVLDSFFQPYKLVGTTLVPLSDLVNGIYQETYEQLENGSKKATPLTPCMRMSHGVFEVKNLMGDEIGHISFACRLTCFGSALLPHLHEVMNAAPLSRKSSSSSSPTRRSVHIDTEKFNPKNKSRERQTPESEASFYELQDAKTKTPRTSSPTKQKSHAFIQTIEIEHQDAQVQIDGTRSHLDKSSKQTQSPESKRRHLEKANSGTVYTIKNVQDEFIFNHYCPPPLVYNSENDRTAQAGFEKSQITGDAIWQDCYYSTTATFQAYQTTTINKQVFIKQRVDYLSGALRKEEKQIDADLNYSLANNNLEESEDQNQYDVVLPVSHQSQRSEMNNQFNFEDMPLLKCLFEEMTKLKNMMQMGPVATKSLSLIDQKNKKQKRPIKSKTPTINVKQKLINEHQQKNFKKTEISGVAMVTPRAEPSRQKFAKPQNRKSILKLNKQPFKSREELLESVNRLALPKGHILTPRNIRGSLVHQNDNFNHGEQPVGPSLTRKRNPEPKLKYGLTNAHRMRVLASHKKINGESMDDKHEELMERVKSNLEQLSINSSGLNLTNQGNSTGIGEPGQGIMGNLDKVMFFDSINSTNQNALNNISASMRSHPTMNFSLLNKVDMESTVFETNKRYSNDFSDVSSSNTAPSRDQGAEIASQPMAKFVQFGDTYVMNTSSNGIQSDEATSEINSVNRASENSVLVPKVIQVAPKKQERTKNIDYSSTSYRDSNEIKSSGSTGAGLTNGVQNIFLRNKGSQDAYDNDFNSSLDTTSLSSKQSTSTTTTSNFFTRFDPKRPASQQSRQSPSQRLTSSQKFQQNIKEEMEEDLDQQDSVASFRHRSRRLPSDSNDNYTGVNRSSADLRSSSKYSSVDSTSNIKSLVDDSLGMSRDSSSRSIRSGKKIFISFIFCELLGFFSVLNKDVGLG